MAFEYDHLDAGRAEFRLLECRTRQGPDDGQSLFSLRKFSFETEIPPYETVSYCWGNPKPTQSISVDGLPLEVPANSGRVLQEVIQLQDAPRFVWIDAFCINQENLEERAQQVPLMRKIYSNGTRNIVYLGQHPEHRTQIDTIQQILSQLQVVTKTYGYDAPNDFLADLHTQEIEVNSDNFPTNVNESALHGLLSNPWFGRAWIIQEVLLAKSNICLYSGTTIDLEDIVLVTSWVSATGPYVFSRPFENVSALRICTSIAAVRDSVQDYTILNFEAALMFTYEQDATDARDKIYSILGLAFSDKVPPLLTVDYHKPWQDVYRDATKYRLLATNQATEIVRLSTCLRTLNHHSQEDFDSCRSTWVPRYEKAELSQWITVPLFHRWEGPIMPQRLPLVKLGTREETIVMLGRSLSTIRDVSLVFSIFWAVDPQGRSEFCQSIREMAQRHKLPPEQVARTLIADTNMQFRRSTPEDRIGYDEAFEYFMSGNFRPMSGEAAAGPHSTPLYRFCHAMTSGLLGRRFAVDDKGRPLLVPRIAEPGDVIVSLYCDEGGAPFVLRKAGEDYRLVGQCYVDGEMPYQKGGVFEIAEDSEYFTLT